MSKRQFREGNYIDFYIIIDGKEFPHNKTILSFRSEFIQCKIRAEPNSKLILDTDNLKFGFDILVTAFDYLYEDNLDDIKNINELLQYWLIYDFLRASFHKDLCAKLMISLVITRIHLNNNETIDQILKTEDYNGDILKNIFSYECINHKDENISSLLNSLIFKNI